MSRMTLLTGRERRRRWSEDDQRRILAVAFAPGSIVADVARQNDVSTSLVYKWRRHALTAESGLTFAPAVVADAPSGAPPCHEETAITVEFAGGARVKIGATASTALVIATLRALR
jgi:transposase